MKRISISVPPFEGDFTVLYGEAEDINKHLSDSGVNELIVAQQAAQCLEFETDGGGKAMVMCITDIDDDLTLFHECLHMSWYVIDFFGVRVAPDNHELLAYMQGYLFGRIKEEIMEY